MLDCLYISSPRHNSARKRLTAFPSTVCGGCRKRHRMISSGVSKATLGGCRFRADFAARGCRKRHPIDNVLIDKRTTRAVHVRARNVAETAVMRRRVRIHSRAPTMPAVKPVRARMASHDRHRVRAHGNPNGTTPAGVTRMAFATASACRIAGLTVCVRGDRMKDIKTSRLWRGRANDLERFFEESAKRPIPVPDDAKEDA